MLRVFQKLTPSTAKPASVGSKRRLSAAISGTQETTSSAQMDAMPMVSKNTPLTPRFAGRDCPARIRNGS